jgi:hypothetical protein
MHPENLQFQDRDFRFGCFQYQFWNHMLKRRRAVEISTPCGQLGEKTRNDGAKPEQTMLRRPQKRVLGR